MHRSPAPCGSPTERERETDDFSGRATCDTQTHSRTHALKHTIHTYIKVIYMDTFSGVILFMFLCAYGYAYASICVGRCVSVCPCLCLLCLCVRAVLPVCIACGRGVHLLSLSRCHGDTTVEEERELTEGRGLCCCLWHGLLRQADMSKYTKIEKNGKTFYHIKAPFTAQ